MTKKPPIRVPRRSEEGYILLSVIFMTVVLIVAVSVAMPRIAKEIQRDREVETMQRGKQYARAIQLYYRKFGNYPPNLDALVKTNDIRFLRKRYLDPMTGKDDWKPILFGQNKTPTAMGFFGQPLAGGATTVAGIGPSGGNNPTGSPGVGDSTGGNSLSGPSSSGSSTAGTAGTTGGPVDTTGGAGANGSTAAATSIMNGQSSGQTFGGAGIIGFEPASPKQSILVYKKKNHYNEWEFTYDPLADRPTIGGNTGMIGQPASSTTTPVGGPQFGGSGTGTGTTPQQ